MCINQSKISTLGQTLVTAALRGVLLVSSCTVISRLSQAENLAKESVARRGDGSLYPLNVPIAYLGSLGTGGECNNFKLLSFRASADVLKKKIEVCSSY